MPFPGGQFFHQLKVVKLPFIEIISAAAVCLFRFLTIGGELWQVEEGDSDRDACHWRCWWSCWCCQADRWFRISIDTPAAEKFQNKPIFAFDIFIDLKVLSKLPIDVVKDIFEFDVFLTTKINSQHVFNYYEFLTSHTINENKS